MQGSVGALQKAEREDDDCWTERKIHYQTLDRIKRGLGVSG